MEVHRESCNFPKSEQLLNLRATWDEVNFHSSLLLYNPAFIITFIKPEDTGKDTY